ncbi:MAG: cytochrome b/b6 domain-containing protein [Hyphomonadaceae bacterium]
MTDDLAASADSRPDPRLRRQSVRRNGWPLAKRALHWVLAISVVVALIAPKPEHSPGLIHAAAGSVAVAAALIRIFWRLLSDVRPRLRDSFRISLRRLPDLGPKAFGAPALQLARLGGFAFLALIPAAFAAALIGVGGGGGESPALELHELLGSVVMYLAIAHAALALAFAVLLRSNIVGLTLTWPGVALEGGARGIAGIILGVFLSVAVIGYVWGPFGLPARLEAMMETGGEHGHDED